MYEKQTWKNGDVITEDKLNHMEEGISTGGGIYTLENSTLFDGEVATTKASESASEADGEIALQGELPKHDISVTLNGQDYALPFHISVAPDGSSSFYYYGEMNNGLVSFDNYPIFITPQEEELTDAVVVTPETGTYSLKISDNDLIVNDGFKSNFIFVVTAEYSGLDVTLNKTWNEINDAMQASALAVVVAKGSDDTQGISMDLITYTDVADGKYRVCTIGNSGGNVRTITLSAENPNSYPKNKVVG